MVLAPACLQRLDLALELGVDLATVAGGDLPASPAHPVHRLAQLAHRTALQREPPRVHERLLPDAYGAKAERAVAGQMAGAGPPHDDLPAAPPGLRDEAGQHVGRGPGGGDRVGRDDRRTADDAIRQHAAAGERQRLVGTQQERRERIVGVGIDDGARRPVLVVGVAVGGRRRADQRAQREHAHGGGRAHQQLDQPDPVAAHARRGCRADGVTGGMVQDAGDHVTGGVTGQGRQQHGADRESPGQPGRPRDPPAGTVGATELECAATEGQHQPQARLHRRVQVPAVDGVERRQRQYARDRQRDRGARAPPQSRRQRQQRDPQDQRQRMGARR